MSIRDHGDGCGHGLWGHGGVNNFTNLLCLFHKHQNSQLLTDPGDVNLTDNPPHSVMMMRLQVVIKILEAFL